MSGATVDLDHGASGTIEPPHRLDVVRHFTVILLVLGMFGVACAGGSVDASAVPELPEATADGVAALLRESERPVVVNVWASWCVPCRSEAPLLDRATARFGDVVRFVGINVRDSQSGAREFIAEFFPDAAIEHLFDRPGQVPSTLGGNQGVPLTFFFEPGGELVELHFGVIDERTLALQVDELLARLAA